MWCVRNYIVLDLLKTCQTVVLDAVTFKQINLNELQLSASTSHLQIMGENLVQIFREIGVQWDRRNNIFLRIIEKLGSY